MTRKNWFKHKQTGEVFYNEGVTVDGKHFVLRDRNRMMTVVYASTFMLEYTKIDVSGFPPLKPKEEKPPFALDKLYRSERGEFWLHEHGDCFVFRQHGSMVRETRSISFVKDLYELGTLHAVEMNTSASMKPPFSRTATYRSVADGSFYEPIPDKGIFCHHGWWKAYMSLKVMEDLYARDLIVRADKYIPASRPVTGSCQGFGGTAPLPKPKKKVLVEWAFSLSKHNSQLGVLLVPDGEKPVDRYRLLKPFKTGRIIEVDA